MGDGTEDYGCSTHAVAEGGRTKISMTFFSVREISEPP